jgi:hypothetical protein
MYLIIRPIGENSPNLVELLTTQQYISLTFFIVDRMDRFRKLFPRRTCNLIGMIHLGPLPGNHDHEEFYRAGSGL